MNEQDIFKSVSELEKDLSLPNGFYKHLLEEDDWSFIIKLHSLIEAAVSRFLSESLRLSTSVCFPSSLLPEDHDTKHLDDVFSWLELSNKRTGKMAFVRSLGLMHKEPRQFISSLSEFRNKLVHDVRNVSFDLKAYINSRDANQLNNFIKDFGFNLKEQFELDGRNLSRREFAIEKPKVVIWLGGLTCLQNIYEAMNLFRLRIENINLKEEMIKLKGLLEESQNTEEQTKEATND